MNGGAELAEKIKIYFINQWADPAPRSLEIRAREAA